MISFHFSNTVNTPGSLPEVSDNSLLSPFHLLSLPVVRSKYIYCTYNCEFYIISTISDEKELDTNESENKQPDEKMDVDVDDDLSKKTEKQKTTKV